MNQSEATKTSEVTNYGPTVVDSTGLALAAGVETVQSHFSKGLMVCDLSD